MLKKPKISLPMSLVFAKEKCSEACEIFFIIWMSAELVEWGRT